jgi:hypothetical protein
MPAAIAIPLIVGAASAGASVYAAKKQSGAAQDAARLQTASADKSGELQAQAARDALTFQQQQAATDAQRFETTQKSNYDQWAARQGYQSSIGSMLGLPARKIPGYVSSMPGGSSQGMPSTGGGAVPQVDWTAAPGQVAQQVSAYFKARGVPDTETPYWVSKAPELAARAKEINDPNYGNTRLAAADIFGGSGGAPAAGAPKPGYLAPLSTLIPPPSYSAQPLTPALQMPRVSY